MRSEIPLDSIRPFAEGLDHPEGLAFDAEGYLWAGGEAGQVYRIDAGGQVSEVARLEGFCAGLAFSPDDELFICHAGKAQVVHVKPFGEHMVFADRAGDHRMVCPNYAVFDRQGNLYVSDSGNWGRRDGCVIRLSPSGTHRVIGGPYGYANGLALSADERTLFMAETDTNRIHRLELASDGSVKSEHLFAQRAGRAPDGLALDAEGNLYCACYASDDILCFSPSGARMRIAHDPFGILLGGCTNMAFGGEQFDEMYVANVSRYGIVRISLGRRGQTLANTGRDG